MRPQVFTHFFSTRGHTHTMHQHARSVRPTAAAAESTSRDPRERNDR